MRVDYVSDLHVSYLVGDNRTNPLKVRKKIDVYLRLTLPERIGDILVIAGDIGEYEEDIIYTLEYYANYYKKVYFVLGNHDLYIVSKRQRSVYHKNSDNKREAIDNLIKESRYNQKIELLDNKKTCYKGLTIAGTPLWYTLSNNQDLMWWESHSNDSQYLLPRGHSIIKEWHKRDLDFYDKLDQEVDLLITHIPPIHVNDYYEPNASYQNMAIARYPLKAKHWVCGHQHTEAIKEINETKIYVNAVGYHDYNNLHNVSKIKTINIRSV